MTGIVNRVPTGLLDLLDMKSRGQSPRELSGQVQGGIDLLPLYEIDQERCAAFTVAGVATPAGFQNLGILVPANEIWHVRHHSVVVSGAAAASRINVSAGVFSFVRLGGNFYSGPVGEANSDSNVANNSQIAAHAGDYWLGPGDSPGVWISTCTGNVTMTVRVLYVPYTR